MTKPIQLHVGYVGITREGKRVEIIANDGSNEYQWGSDEYDWYMTSGNFWRNGKEDEEDIVGPWVDTPVEPPKVPREFWVMSGDLLVRLQKPEDTTGYIHVREVLTDD
jgi:hypothetical protein